MLRGPKPDAMAPSGQGLREFLVRRVKPMARNGWSIAQGSNADRVPEAISATGNATRGLLKIYPQRSIYGIADGVRQQ